jgi:predicted GH43/DUF377 family glycosyl hydrolase
MPEELAVEFAEIVWRPRPACTSTENFDHRGRDQSPLTTRNRSGYVSSISNDPHDPRELFHRYERNPILVASSWPKMVNAVFNPGATMFDGETLLLTRVEDRTGLSRLTVCRSRDGYTDWIVEPERSLVPNLDSWEEKWGIEDPRITALDTGEYLITYTGFSGAGPLICLASTRDFVTFERRGLMQSPEDKDAALFPRLINGRWAMIHRPVPNTERLGAHIWLSWSPDLKHWGDPTVLIQARHGGWWDANKVGLGPPPMETPAGWLILYHGVRTTVAGSLYRLGLAMLDRGNPARVVARSNEWIFGPCAPYEVAGDVPDVVFPCGWILDDDGDTIRMYYGAADSCVAVATASLAELLNHLYLHPMN